MTVKLNKEESQFRNDLIFSIDAKAINIDNTLVNLYMLLRNNGSRPKSKTVKGKGDLELDKLKENFKLLEIQEGKLKGFNDYPEAVELWLRTNLVNLVNRGNFSKEKISSLKPIHIESYKLRNARNTRDYFSADQVFLMLGTNTEVKNLLTAFLSEGWDSSVGKGEISNLGDVDIDTLGILHLIKTAGSKFLNSENNSNKVKPLLIKQAELYCNDINKILAYKKSIPRNVLIEYIKIITSFHLSLYIQKLVYLLPKMIQDGNINIQDDFSIVLDITDNFESKVSELAMKDVEDLFNHLNDYIKATFQLNATLRFLHSDKTNSDDLMKALEILKNRPNNFETYFRVLWDNILGTLDNDDKERLLDKTKYESSYFDKYVECLILERGAYQYKYHTQLIDNLSQKNTERSLMNQGRSRKHKRKFTLGTKLLETFVQLSVLKLEGNKYITKPISIEEFLGFLRDNYGLIINGIGEERFKNTDITTHIAFKENTEAFKNKLRQIGFYNILSDAYLMQKIRPRYEIF